MLPPVPVPPVPVPGGATRWWRSSSSEGQLLVFPVGEVPEMPRGKGNKLFDIPGKKAESREELMIAVAVFGARPVAACPFRRAADDLDADDLKDYLGERAQRGAVLPRGWRTVERIAAIA